MAKMHGDANLSWVAQIELKMRLQVLKMIQLKPVITGCFLTGFTGGLQKQVVNTTLTYPQLLC